jgi:hypothetical protein
MGKYGRDVLEGVRESVLRLPRHAQAILGQAEIVNAYARRAKEIENPRYFADALFSGLIYKQGFKIVLRRALASASSDMLYDTTQETPFAEYEAFSAFCAKLDLENERRGEINKIRSELLERVSMGGSEKQEVQGRVEQTAQAYAAAMQEIKNRISRADLGKRKALAEAHEFYSAVLKIAEIYMRNYLC